jgi:hypothetical protein
VTAQAEPAGPVRSAEPGDAYARTEREPVHTGAQRVDATYHLVTRRDLRPTGREVALGEVQIGAAHAATADLDAQLARPRVGNRTHHPPERVVVDRRR